MLIIDTGVLVAAADRSDPQHEVCAALVSDESSTLTTTAMVIAEAAYLLDRQIGPHVESLLYQSIVDGALYIAPLTLSDWRRVRELVDTYADLRLGGTDASLIALAERTGERRIATLNRRDFAVVRPVHVAAFVLLP